MTRKEFVQLSSLAAIGSIAGSSNVLASPQKKEAKKLLITHTNDVHSRLDPFPMDGSKLQGLGGIKARKQLLDKLRKEHKNVLLLDCGDMFQGTPYFNLYKGEPEIKAMSHLGYTAGTLGNHDFDGGVENLANQLIHANFPIINANYDFSDSPLENKIMPYLLKKIDGIKVGIIGVGIELDGLVPKNLTGKITYKNPIPIVNNLAEKLKIKKRCDMVIVISHLGFEYDNKNKISDKVLANETQFVDLILGGHTHTFLEQPFEAKNLQNQTVLINQVGWAGVQLGTLEFDFFQQKDISFVPNPHNGIFMKETSV